MTIKSKMERKFELIKYESILFHYVFTSFSSLKRTVNSVEVQFTRLRPLPALVRVQVPVAHPHFHSETKQKPSKSPPISQYGNKSENILKISIRFSSTGIKNHPGFDEVKRCND